MKINVVTEPEGSWILSRIAKESIKLVDGKISTKPDKSADINYFVNYNLFEPVDTKTISFFTHRENRYADKWKEAEENSSAVTFMADMFKPKNKNAFKVVPTGMEVKPRKIIAGVVGRIYKSGRKGEEDIQYLVDKTSDHVEWRALGDKSWLNIGISKITEYTNDPDAKKWYEDIDVLVSMAKLEGGPIAIAEAAKLGKRIIARITGNYELWASLVMGVQTKEQALHWFIQILAENKLRNDLRAYSWDTLAQDHKKVFEFVHTLK